MKRYALLPHDTTLCCAMIYLFFVILSLVPTSHAEAVTLPSGFKQTAVAVGLTNPTAMQFAPDGRIFVLEQAGNVLIFKNGELVPTPFVTLSVDSTNERGLLGIAFDPNFNK